MIFWRIRITKDGHAVYCSNVYGNPVQMDFQDAFNGPALPYLFCTEEEARKYWKLYRDTHPASVEGWIAYFEEIDLEEDI